MTHEDQRSDQSSGFIFGLTLGAAMGALTALLVKNHSEDAVVQDFESKIKEFFQDIVKGPKSKTQESPKKIEYNAVKDENPTPIIIKKKSPPKTFVKSRR